MLILQAYVTVTVLATVGLAIGILSTVILRGSGSQPIKTTEEQSGDQQVEAERQLGMAWWIEVVTAQPYCTYYFGPFASAHEAELSQAGYLKDLEQEGAKGITAQIKWCKPSKLTIAEDKLVEAG